MKHTVPRICIICHAQKLEEPVTANDCLGFSECESCTKIEDGHSTIQNTSKIPMVHFNNDEPLGD